MIEAYIISLHIFRTHIEKWKYIFSNSSTLIKLIDDHHYTKQKLFGAYPKSAIHNNKLLVTILPSQLTLLGDTNADFNAFILAPFFI